MLPMPDTQTTEDRATQLFYSIQFKLSHAIWLPYITHVAHKTVRAVSSMLSLCVVTQGVFVHRFKFANFTFVIGDDVDFVFLAPMVISNFRGET